MPFIFYFKCFFLKSSKFIVEKSVGVSLTAFLNETNCELSVLLKAQRAR